MNNTYWPRLLTIALLLLSFYPAAQTDERQMEEIVLTKGKKVYKSKKENPAYAIMQEVWKRKRNNGLDKFDTYSFREYEKIQFDMANIDSAFMNRKVFKKLDFIFDYADSAANGNLALPLFLNESVYTNIGQNNPSKRKKRLLVAQKTSGFEDNQIVTLTAKNLYKEIDIYDNTINYFDIGFQSPVSRDGFSTYNYELMDTLTLNGQEVYHIRYEPRRSDVLAFEGQLYISTDHYAVTQATLRSTNKMSVNFVNGIFTELEYDNPNDSTFLPKKYRTVLDLSAFSKSKNAKSLTATRSVDYTDYKFNPALSAVDFETKEAELSEDFIRKDDQYWEAARIDSLNQQEKGIYEMLEKLEETPRFRRITKTYETFASGYYNVGKAVDIGDLYSIYGNNEVEGHRIRLGGRTYFSQNDDWRIQGYGAYGFKDRKFKYGAEAKYMFNKVNRFTIGAGTRRDVMQLGVQLTTDDGIMSRSFASSSVFGRGENASLSSVNQTNVFVAIDPLKNFTVRLDGTLQSIKSANEEGFNLYYHDNDGMLRKTVNDSHVTLSLIARPGAKFSQTGVDRYEHSTLAPTIVVKYTRGLENVFNADYGYNKLQFMFFKPMLIGSWGKSFISLEAGKNFNAVPLALQNVIPGNQSYSLVANTFSQLNYYEFVADTYTTGHLEHHFNGKILSFIPLIKKLKLREVAFIRGAYGTLSEASKNINVEGYKYSAPDRNIYYEYGFGIENIGWGNLRFLRVDFNWRGNYLNNPNIEKFGIKAGIQFFY
ncbi:carboxypeptidase-like regulatory domain-containing protein [Marnyiella aurantia]|uniref:Carboxypeptidase-like regulatory domain-containing protein n=1 Tax=Marnyiella aurantia TaxID=2758037 RepID=A0A7D7QUS4_9FLAO|nr:DUF5686 family protein [Marnyiella aurantia]MBA5247181.1 carboxypeptidase-like regulatory domain-containing protein [Marnyiella aurantia]QMS97490.1 carboxypeptidase-like regulatory domain-containing protein [Marnyiella aurantia]